MVPLRRPISAKTNHAYRVSIIITFAACLFFLSSFHPFHCVFIIDFQFKQPLSSRLKFSLFCFLFPPNTERELHSLHSAVLFESSVGLILFSRSGKSFEFVRLDTLIINLIHLGHASSLPVIVTFYNIWVWDPLFLFPSQAFRGACCELCLWCDAFVIYFILTMPQLFSYLICWRVGVCVYVFGK